MIRQRKVIVLERLINHPKNPRVRIDVEELTASIKEVGQLVPLLVRPSGEHFEIISGHRRKEALRQAGRISAECDVLELDDEQAFKALMVANIQAQSLTEIEEAEGIRRMMEEFEWSQGRVAKEFGKSQQWVSYRLALIQNLALEVQELVTTRVVNPTQAREIAQAPKELQSAIADKVVKEDLSTRETEALVKVLKDESIPPDLKQKAIESPNLKPKDIETAARIQDPDTRREVAEKLEHGQMTTQGAYKAAIKAEIEQVVKEQRDEELVRHQVDGTVPTFRTPEQIARDKLIRDADEMLLELRNVTAHSLFMVKHRSSLLVSTGKTEEVIAALDKIVNIAQEIRVDILAATSSQAEEAKNSNIVILRRHLKG
jgi:ParB family chromosome partitioning protein